MRNHPVKPGDSLDMRRVSGVYKAQKEKLSG